MSFPRSSPSSRALKPGGHFITATHVGDEDQLRTEAYGGVPVRWTTHKWRPEQLVDLIEQAGLRPVAELRLPPRSTAGRAWSSWPSVPAFLRPTPIDVVAGCDAA